MNNRMTRITIALVLIGWQATAAAAPAKKEIPIACVVNALSPEQRTRESVLLKEHLASTKSVRERDDGYTFEYPADLALFQRMAELVSLEHRCCPFLDFQLEWVGASDTPVLHVTGGARVKPFVLQTFARAH